MEERATSRGLVAVAFLACSLALLIALRAVLPLAHALLLVGIVAWYALPGVAFVRRACLSDADRRRGGSGLFATAIGAVWGYAASCLVLLALWVAGVRNETLLLILAPVIAAAILLPVARRVDLSLPAPCRRDLLVLLLLLLLVPLLVGRPYAAGGGVDARRPHVSRVLHRRLHLADGGDGRGREG